MNGIKLVCEKNYVVVQKHIFLSHGFGACGYGVTGKVKFIADLREMFGYGYLHPYSQIYSKFLDYIQRSCGESKGLWLFALSTHQGLLRVQGVAWAGKTSISLVLVEDDFQPVITQTL